MTSPKRPVEKDGLVLIPSHIVSLIVRGQHYREHECPRPFPCADEYSTLPKHIYTSERRGKRVAPRIVDLLTRPIHNEPCVDECSRTETGKVHITSERVLISSLSMYSSVGVPPTICLDHRPEPALLGEIRSVLRNLKFPKKKLVSPRSSSPLSANRSSASTQDMVTADSPTTKSMSPPNLITSERVLPPQPLPSHTSSLSKAVDTSPPNLLATNLITSERILPPRFPLGHTSTLPKVGDSSQSTFDPIKEAAANLHAGDYTAMLHCLLLDDHFPKLPPQKRIAVVFGQGVALFTQDKLRDAAKKFIQCKKEAESAGFQADVAICHVYLGDIHFARQDYPKAAKHYTTAIRLYSLKCIATRWYGMSISAIYAKCGSAYHHDDQVAKAFTMYEKAICAKYGGNDTDSINDAHVPVLGKEKSVSTESGSTSSTSHSSTGAQDIVFADSRTTSPNFNTSNGIHSSQSPSHTFSLPKMVYVSPPNNLAIDLITSERIHPPRSPPGHTSTLPKVVDSSRSTFGPIKEAAAALHVGNYMNMFQCLLLDDLSKLAPQVRIAVIFGQGVALFKRNKLRDAAKRFIQCEREAESEGFQADAAICHVYLGDIRFVRQDYPKAAKHYTTAVKLYSPKCIAAGWYGMSIPTVSAIYAKCGSAYRNAHQVANAVEMYKKAIDCAHPLSQDKRSAHTSLGNLYQSLKENKLALTEYEESMHLAKELGDSISLGWAHGNMGNAYLGLFQKDKALHHLEKSLELALDHEPIPQAIGRAYNSIGTAHLALNNLEKAEEFYKFALNMTIYGNDTPGQARAYGNLGNVLMIWKMYEKSISHYTEVLSLSKDHSTISTAHHNRGCAYYEWAESEKRLMDRHPSPVGASQPTDSDKGEKADSTRSHSHSAMQHGSTMAAQAFRDDNPAIIDPPTPLKPTATVFYYGPEMSDCLEANHPPVIPDSILDLYEKGRKDLEKVVAFHEQTLSSIKGSTKGLSLSVSLFETNARTFHRLQDCLVNLGLWKEALVVAEQSRTRASVNFSSGRSLLIAYQQPPSRSLRFSTLLEHCKAVPLYTFRTLVPDSLAGSCLDKMARC